MKKILKFTTDSQEIISLASSDYALAGLINRIGNYSLTLRTDPFLSLSRSIVGQQLSLSAARTIWNRVEEVCGGISTATIANISVDELRSTGLSQAKAMYIKGLAVKAMAGSLDIDTLRQLNDEDVIDVLTKIKGVGRWTAEMFLIFSLGRLDVLSLNDAGLRRGIKWLYGLRELPDIAAIDSIGTRWAPYRSLASLYLWEALNRGLADINP